MMRALVLAGLDIERARNVLRRLLRRQVEAAPQDRLQHGYYVGRFDDQRRTLLEQPVGALGARIERGAGHREHLAALLAGQPRRDQRAGAARRLHDHHADG
jgi:hypothetical protein